MYYRSYEPIPACDMENPGITKSIMTRENTITLYFSFFHILSVFSRCEKTLRMWKIYSYSPFHVFRRPLGVSFHCSRSGALPRILYVRGFRCFCHPERRRNGGKYQYIEHKNVY